MSEPVDVATSARSFWDRQARRYDRSMILLGRPLPRALELCAEAARGCDQVLEVAAGTGLFTEALARHAQSVLATDYSEAMLERLRARMAAQNLLDVSCRQADLYALDVTPGSFDLVVAANVLHLVPDLPRALAALGRPLKLGARLVAPTYCHDQTLRSKAASRALALAGFPAARRFTLSSLIRAVKDAGFVPLRTELIPGLIPIGYLEAALPVA